MNPKSNVFEIKKNTNVQVIKLKRYHFNFKLMEYIRCTQRRSYLATSGYGCKLSSIEICDINFEKICLNQYESIIMLV